MFVEDVKRELAKKDNHTWTPVQRPYVPCFSNTYTYWCICVYRDISPTSQVRVEVGMKSGHSFWAKYPETKEAIDLDGPFNDYWISSDHEFTVMS